MVDLVTVEVGAISAPLAAAVHLPLSPQRDEAERAGSVRTARPMGEARNAGR